MKTNRKGLSFLLALVLLVTMTMALPLTAFAAPGDLTIEPQDNLKAITEKIDVYKVFDLSYDKDNDSYAYEVVTPGFASFTNTSLLGSMNLEQYLMDKAATTTGAVIVSRGAIISGSAVSAAFDEINMIELAKELYIFASNAAIAVTTTSALTTTKPSHTFTGLSPGYYLVVGYGSHDGMATNSTVDAVFSRAMLVSINGVDDVTIFLKADAPDIDKKVWNEDLADLPNNELKWYEWADADIGEIVDFRSVSKVPNTALFSKYTFIVHDEMSPGLTFDPTSVVITVGGIRLVEGASNDFTVNTSISDGCTFEIEFDKDLFVIKEARGGMKYNSIRIGDRIEIGYKAVLNDKAVIGRPGNPNVIYLEYSNNQYDTNKTGKTKRHEVVVYTYKILLEKYTKVDGDKRYLAGAEFELLATIGGIMQPMRFVVTSAAIATDSAEYRLPVTGDTGIVTVLKSPTSGAIDILGLDQGTYRLRETVPPIGFNPLENDIIINITHDTNSANMSACRIVYDGVVLGDTEKIGILNQIGLKFPGVGGIGRTVFMVIGSILMCGALLALYVRRRAREE